MLTADLVRASVRGGVVRPRYVDADDPALVREAERLVALFEAHVGEKVGDLDEAIADHIGDSTDYLIQRGLTKLLRDLGTFEVRAARPPEELRGRVFELAAAGDWPVRPGGGDGLGDREAVLARAAEELGITPTEVEDALFADLDTELRLVALDAPSPAELLARYNMALAQAVLLRAHEVRVELPQIRPARARQLFRFIKFRRLMHRAERTDDGYRLVLDGPMSLLRQTSRYGVAMALLLPGLALCERYALEADVTWGKARRPLRFELDEGVGLRSHLADRGTWKSEEERHLERTFAKTDTPWRLERATRVVDLDGAVLLPDYVLRHPDGREALLDIVWFWRKDAFTRRLERLRASGPPNLIVAVATRMNTDRKTPDVGESAVYPFKGVISPTRLIALAEEHAVGPGGV